MVSTPACHAGDRGSIPRRGDNIFRLFIHDERNISRVTFQFITYVRGLLIEKIVDRRDGVAETRD